MLTTSWGKKRRLSNKDQKDEGGGWQGGTKIQKNNKRKTKKDKNSFQLWSVSIM